MGEPPLPRTPSHNRVSPPRVAMPRGWVPPPRAGTRGCWVPTYRWGGAHCAQKAPARGGQGRRLRSARPPSPGTAPPGGCLQVTVGDGGRQGPPDTAPSCPGRQTDPPPAPPRGCAVGAPGAPWASHGCCECPVGVPWVLRVSQGPCGCHGCPSGTHGCCERPTGAMGAGGVLVGAVNAPVGAMGCPWGTRGCREYPAGAMGAHGCRERPVGAMGASWAAVGAVNTLRVPRETTGHPWVPWTPPWVLWAPVGAVPRGTRRKRRYPSHSGLLAPRCRTKQRRRVLWYPAPPTATTFSARGGSAEQLQLGTHTHTYGWRGTQTPPRGTRGGGCRGCGCPQGVGPLGGRSP